MFITKRENKYEKVFKRICSKSEGFTFIETLAVLGICAILSAGCLFSATKLIAMAKKTSAKSQIQQYSSAMQIYFLDCGRFPTTEQGISALWKKPTLYPVPENWNGPYIDHEPEKDPWGTDFQYFGTESTSLLPEIPSNLPFILISYGADKKQGGEGESSDIFSWK